MALRRESEIQIISDILNSAVAEVGASTNGKSKHVRNLDEANALIYGQFPYRRRAIVVEGRPLTVDFTAQPVLAVKDLATEIVTPLPYAENVLAHPLKGKIAGALVEIHLAGRRN